MDNPTPIRINEISTKQMLELLANDRRRFTIFYLAQHGVGRSRQLGDIAERVAAWENDAPIAKLSRRQRKRVYDSLQQHHIPALAEQNVVQYDPENCTLVLTPRGITLANQIDRFRTENVRWWQFNFGLGLVGLVIAFLHLFGIFTVISPLASLLGISIGIVVSTIVHFSDLPARFRSSEKPPTVQD